MNKKRPIQMHIHCLDIKNVWGEKRILKATVGEAGRGMCMGLMLSIRNLNGLRFSRSTVRNWKIT